MNNKKIFNMLQTFSSIEIHEDEYYNYELDERLNEEEKKELRELEEALRKDYSDFLDLPKKEHDRIIKDMYKNTIYADESPEVLEEILTNQLTGHDKLLN